MVLLEVMLHHMELLETMLHHMEHLQPVLQVMVLQAMGLPTIMEVGQDLLPQEVMEVAHQATLLRPMEHLHTVPQHTEVEINHHSSQCTPQYHHHIPIIRHNHNLIIPLHHRIIKDGAVFLLHQLNIHNNNSSNKIITPQIIPPNNVRNHHHGMDSLCHLMMMNRLNVNKINRSSHQLHHHVVLAMEVGIQQLQQMGEQVLLLIHHILIMHHQLVILHIRHNNHNRMVVVVVDIHLIPQLRGLWVSLHHRIVSFNLICFIYVSSVCVLPLVCL